MDSCIQLALNRLAPHGEYLERLNDLSARMEFFIGWTIRSNGGAELRPDLLARLGKLGIALSLDVYGKSSQAEA